MAAVESRLLKISRFPFVSKSILFILFFILATPFFAKAISFTVSGATTFSQDSATPPTPSKILINAGYALPTASACVKDGINPCNTCMGNKLGDPNSNLEFPAPCNERSIYDELTMTISVESDKSDFNTLPIGLSTASDYSASGTRLSNITTTAVNGRSYSVSATWSQWATALGISLTCSTATGCGGTKTFYFGPIKDEKFAEYFTVVITYSIINYTSEGTPLNGVTKALSSMCPLTSTDPLRTGTKSETLCYFEMYPGDGKAYVTNLINGWETTPVDPDTSLNYTNVVMFFAEKTGSQTALQTLQSINNNSPKGTIGITTTDGDPLSDYKVGGLENEKKYCFLPAMQDQTGNIIYFLDFQKIANSVTEAEGTFDLMCASPSEVVGVLSDKDCFIATVAFGSRTHPFLTVLREFRNKVLHPFSLGKKLIKYYYKNGPNWAKQMAGSTLATAAVKVALLPVIAIAYLVLNPIWLVLILSCTGFVFWFRKRKGIA